MRLNDTFLVTQWEKGHALKKVFIDHQLSPDAMKAGNFNLTSYEWQLRVAHAEMVIESPKSQKIYYITPNTQKEADRISTGKTIDTRWFRQIPDDKVGLYVTGKEEFFKFIKHKDSISVIYFYLWGAVRHPRYMSYSIPLDGRQVELHSWQSGEIAERFFNLLLFIELGETEVVEVKPKQKVKWGKGGEDKLFNEAELNNVVLITPNYNKIIVVDGGIVVSSHWRVQPYGSRNEPKYRLRQIPTYAKSGIIRRKK